MRRSLSAAFEPAVWPEGMRLARFESSHAPSVHALLVAGYRQGGGGVAAYAPWFRGLTHDEDFDADNCFLAFRDATLAGVALCWSSGFVKDLCVASSERRSGLGSALLTHAFGHFSRLGRTDVALKVHADNPSGAVRLYTRLGFVALP